MAADVSRHRDVVLSQHIASEVRQSILRGEIGPDERITQERLAERFGASRFPVREALRILERDGLVTLHSNRGAWVNSLSQDECIELYRMREQLEPLLIEDSVPRLGDSVIREIEGLLEDLGRVDVMDVVEYLDADRRFHFLTYSGSELSVVRESVNRLLEQTTYYRRAYHDLVLASDGRAWILEYDHRLILDAIQRGDAHEAAVIMRLHTRRARIALEAHHEIFEPSDRPHN